MNRITYYCTLCRKEVPISSFEDHRKMHLENPFVSYPTTVEEIIEKETGL